MAETRKKNEFEIASDYVTAIAKIASDQAARLANLVAVAAPPVAQYSLGDFLLNQMQNSTRLMETYVEAGRELTKKASDRVAKAAASVRPHSGAATESAGPTKRRTSRRRAAKA